MCSRSAEFSLLVAAAVPPPLAGQSIATALLLRYLRASGLEHAVVNIGREFYFERRALHYARRIFDVARYPLQTLRAARRLEARPTVFYLQLGQSVQAMLRDLPLLHVAERAGWPVVLHVHGGSFRSAYDRAPVPIRAAMQRALARTSRVVVLSPGLTAMFDGLVDPAALEVVDNPVEEELVACARALPPRDWTTPMLTALYLSNLYGPKGHATFLEAAARAEAEGLPCRFLLAGAVTQTTQIDPVRFIESRGLKSTRYLGPVSGEAKRKILAESDVFVLPTEYLEGQPIAVLEAMHFGLPIVSTARGGLADTVLDGENGLVVEPRAPEQLVGALRTLCGDRQLAARISSRNREIASERYTESAHGGAMMEVFSEVASGGPV